MRRRSLVILCAAVAALAAAVHPAAAEPTGSAQRRALVVYVTWGAANGTPAAPKDLSAADVARAVDVTANDWYRTVSHQNFGGWRATTFGPYSIATPRLDSGTCGTTFLNDIRYEAQRAVARAVSFSDYDAVVIYFGATGTCSWQSAFYANTSYLHGNVATRNVVQQLGRHLKLAPAEGLRCREFKRYVTLGGLCQRVVGVDPFNVMGSGNGSFSVVQQGDLGWLAGRTRDAEAGLKRYRLVPLEQIAAGPQALRLYEPEGVTLWLEYRRPTGVDFGMPGGPRVFVYRSTPSSGTTSVLLDMHPGGGFEDAGLRAGESFTVPASGSRIKVISTLAGAAVVEVNAQP